MSDESRAVLAFGGGRSASLWGPCKVLWGWKSSAVPKKFESHCRQRVKALPPQKFGTGLPPQLLSKGNPLHQHPEAITKGSRKMRGGKERAWKWMTTHDNGCDEMRERCDSP